MIGEHQAWSGSPSPKDGQSEGDGLLGGLAVVPQAGGDCVVARATEQAEGDTAQGSEDVAAVPGVRQARAVPQGHGLARWPRFSNDASSLARNTNAAATSSGRPTRRTEMTFACSATPAHPSSYTCLLALPPPLLAPPLTTRQS